MYMRKVVYLPLDSPMIAYFGFWAFRSTASADVDVQRARKRDMKRKEMRNASLSLSAAEEFQRFIV